MSFKKVICPICGGENTAAWSEETGFFRCNLCGAEGYIETPTEGKKESKEEWLQKQPWFKLQSKRRLEIPVEPIEDKDIVAWFNKRGISEETLINRSVTSGMDWMQPNGHDRPVGEKCRTIHFNYYRDGELMATKLRSFDKCFRWSVPGCDNIPYNLDSIKRVPGCYITEGEIDALSLHEVGLRAVISAVSIQEIINVFESHLKRMDFVFICADNDQRGLELAEKIKKYLTAKMGKIATVEVISNYGTRPDGTPIKDANECLATLGPTVFYDKIVNFKSNNQN